MDRRAFLKNAGAASLAAFLAACTKGTTSVRPRSSLTTPPPTSLPPTSPPPTTSPPPVVDTRALFEAANLPKEIVRRLARGWRADRGGELIMVPRGFYFFDGGISHTTPWPYTSDIPMVWYGPGIVPERGAISRPVTAADVAPTMARMLGFSDFEAPDGEPMEEVLDPGAPKPKLIVLLVWDAAGSYVLDLHPGAWPNLEALLKKGTHYTNATIGSSPSSTAPIHSTFGAGAFPDKHGILDNLVRYEDGNLGDPWKYGPDGMLLPTLADIYQEAMGRRAMTGCFATLAWHLGMLGHGSLDPARQQLAVLRERGGGEGAEGISWGLSETQGPHYRFPEYVNDLPPIQTYFEVANRADGEDDGLWRGHVIADLKTGFDTPARVPYQERAIEEVIRREGFGQHDATDLFFINYKLIDEIGHKFTASSIEMRDSIIEQDRNLPIFISFLDEQVGRGNWVLLVTADHGHSADPEVSGGFRIKESHVEEHVEEKFGGTRRHPLIEKVRPGWLFLHQDEMEKRGVTLDETSVFLETLTKLDTAKDPAEVPPADADETVVQSAFPAALLEALLNA